jgi:hypothetical protein
VRAVDLFRARHYPNVRADFAECFLDAAQVAGTVVNQSNHDYSVEATGALFNADMAQRECCR